MSAISYLDVVQLKGDLFVGGLLSVDELGIPAEFIHSEQIRPTALQVSLYGSTLGKYLLLDVLGKGLAESSQHKGLPLVVASRDLLPLGDRIRRPVCCLSLTQHRPSHDIGELDWVSQNELQVQLQENRSPLLFQVLSRENFNAEKSIAAFRNCAGNFDLLEPLGRVRRTLETLMREEAQAQHA